MHQICTNFWIPKSRKQEKRIIKKCLVCRQHERKGFSYLPLPDLSSIRLIKDFPFTYIGADYDGPLMLKILIQKIKFLKLGYFYTFASTLNLYLDLVHDCCSRTWYMTAVREHVSDWIWYMTAVREHASDWIWYMTAVREHASEI